MGNCNEERDVFKKTKKDSSSPEKSFSLEFISETSSTDKRTKKIYERTPSSNFQKQNYGVRNLNEKNGNSNISNKREKEIEKSTSNIAKKFVGGNGSTSKIENSNSRGNQIIEYPNIDDNKSKTLNKEKKPTWTSPYYINPILNEDINHKIYGSKEKEKKNYEQEQIELMEQGIIQKKRKEEVKNLKEFYDMVLDFSNFKQLKDGGWKNIINVRKIKIY